VTALTWKPLGPTGRCYHTTDGRWTINRLARLWELWDKLDPDHPTYHDTRRQAEIAAQEAMDA